MAQPYTGVPRPDFLVVYGCQQYTVVGQTVYGLNHPYMVRRVQTYPKNQIFIWMIPYGCVLETFHTRKVQNAVVPTTL